MIPALKSIEKALNNKGFNNKDTAEKILLQLRLDGWHLISSPSISDEKDDYRWSRVRSKCIVDNKIFDNTIGYHNLDNKSNIEDRVIHYLFAEIGKYLSNLPENV